MIEEASDKEENRSTFTQQQKNSDDACIAFPEEAKVNSFGPISCYQSIQYCKIFKILFRQFCRFAIYMAIATVIFSIFFSVQHNNNFSSYSSSETIMMNKEIKGVFPKLNGQPSQLVGKWRLDFSFIQPRYEENFLFTFQQNGILTIAKANCEGSIQMLWSVSFFNIWINSIVQPSQYEQCIRKNNPFFDYADLMTVWTISYSNLYILTQQYKAEEQNTNVFIFTPWVKKSD